MTHDQESRLLTLSHDCAMLIVELQNDRAGLETGPEKGRLRAVANHLEEAHQWLSAAITRMKQ